MELQAHFCAVSRELGKDSASARYYPYAELKHTWCFSGKHLEFKVSDYLDGSPDAVLESLAWYLLCRAYRLECPDREADLYLTHVHSRQMWSRNRELYFSRAKNLSFDPKGEVRDLEAAFRYVNSFYFGAKLAQPMLAWTSESPRTRLGFYFAPLNLLAANSVLDSERVPRYVLEFVVYHELLHFMDAGSGGPRRRVHHTRSFKEQEREFSHLEASEGWLRKLVMERRR